MKTATDRPAPSVVEAAIIGDSHAIAIWKELAPGTVFRYRMTAPAKHFDGCFYEAGADGPRITATHVRDTFPRADEKTLQALENARPRLDAQLRPILTAGLPVVSSLGAASYRFARRTRIMDADGTRFSRKLLRAAAAEFARHYLGFHEQLLPHVPRLIFVIGPCRYPDRERDQWLSYDAMLTERMAALGAEVIDTREAAGDDDLRLRPEYEAEDILHGNRAWVDLVMARIQPLIGTPAQGVAAG